MSDPNGPHVLSRRSFALGTLAAALIPASAQYASAMPLKRFENKTYVLVHGAYHGGWCWQEVAARLRKNGHIVYTPTQTGLGERSHLISFKPTLDTFIEDIVKVLEYEALNDVILVGHSFAGSTVSGVADRMPQRIRHLVYLDALILQPGQAPFDGLPDDVVEKYRRLAQESSGGLSVPPPPPKYFGVVDPQQVAWLKQMLTPQPFGTYLSKLNLTNPVGNGVKATYIACSNPYFKSTKSSREFVKTTSWAYRELSTAHDAMLLKPAELTQMLEEID